MGSKCEWGCRRGGGWEAVAVVQERLDNDCRIIPSRPPSSRLGIASSRRPVPVIQLDTFPLLTAETLLRRLPHCLVLNISAS